MIYARIGDVQGAKKFYKEAFMILENCPTSPTQRESQALACRRVGELFQYDNPQEALTWLQRGLEICRDDLPEQSAALYLTYGGLQVWLGHYEAAQKAIEAVEGSIAKI